VACGGEVGLRSFVGRRHTVAVVLLNGIIFPGALERHGAIPVVLCSVWAGEALPHFVHGLCSLSDRAMKQYWTISEGAQETDIVHCLSACALDQLYLLVSEKQQLDSVRFDKANY
jgi:hypothetical protein